ncbi:MAG TPA: ankyrin repeat domain-containing protein, partial [Bryobacteraceae bacterium]|nr:ankyrin repeat domain-containing protein [Bryobacteraceae bacterium]
MSPKLSSVLCLLVLGAVSLPAEEPSDRFYQAIRNNDLTALRELVKGSGVNAKDKHDSTPLMFAAAFGSIDAMKLLLDAGAQVNARNTFDVTALLWCAGDPAKARLLVEKGADVNARSKQSRTPLIVAAAHDGNSQTVKLLIEKGADVKAADGNKYTALYVASEANDTDSVRLLIEKGADVNAKNVYGDTPVMAAAGHGNLETTRLLLAKGADVNVVDEVEAGRVKNGPIALGKSTALHFAAPYAGAGAVKLLLDAGANVDAQDVRGITPLMLAVTTDRPDTGSIRLLLAKGASKNIKSKDGETAVDWAKKLNNPGVLALLGVEPREVASVAVPASEVKLDSPREAAAKSLALVQRSSGGFFQEGGCVSCHAQNLTALAQVTARAQGIPVDEKSETSQLKAVRLQWGAFAEVLLQRMDPPGAVDTMMYSLLHLEVENAPADSIIDSLIHNVAGQQRKNGSWSLMGTPRPPIEDGDFSRTAIAL